MFKLFKNKSSRRNSDANVEMIAGPAYQSVSTSSRRNTISGMTPFRSPSPAYDGYEPKAVPAKSPLPPPPGVPSTQSVIDVLYSGITDSPDLRHRGEFAMSSPRHTRQSISSTRPLKSQEPSDVAPIYEMTTAAPSTGALSPSLLQFAFTSTESLATALNRSLAQLEAGHPAEPAGWDVAAAALRTPLPPSPSSERPPAPRTRSPYRVIPLPAPSPYRFTSGPPPYSRFPVERPVEETLGEFGFIDPDAPTPHFKSPPYYRRLLRNRKKHYSYLTPQPKLRQ